MANSNLTNAKRVKNDEFYTQYGDIQKEIGAYLEYDSDMFRGKVVYCNCDDPFESNFFRYFVLQFQQAWIETAHHHELQTLADCQYRTCIATIPSFRL